jgi:penicillin G amidase
MPFPNKPLVAESLRLFRRATDRIAALLAIAIACTWTIPAVSGERAQESRLVGLSGPVEVCLDGHSMPHIFADNWEDASRVLGYLHASNRLWQMDLLRRQASGQLAEILGPDGLESDKLMRQLGIRKSCEALWNSDAMPAAMRAELGAYSEGVNQRIGELSAQDLPLPFQALQYSPAAWTPVDSLVFSKYMGWDQGGTFDDLWFGSIVEKIGPAAFQELWPIDRPYEQPTVGQQSNREKAVQEAEGNRLSLLPDANVGGSGEFRLKQVNWLPKLKPAQPMVLQTMHAFNQEPWAVLA